MRPGRGHDLMIGTHHGTIRAILAREPLNDLIGLLAPPRVDHLNSSAMFAMFDGKPLLPTIEYDSQRMAFAMPIDGQIVQ